MDALPQYSQVGIPAECIEKVSEYVNSRDLAAQPCGKYEIDGEQIYVSIQEYETKSYMETAALKHIKDMRISSVFCRERNRSG